MTRLKRFKIGLFTITLGMVLVGASFALADDKAVAEGIPTERIKRNHGHSGAVCGHCRK